MSASNNGPANGTTWTDHGFWLNSSSVDPNANSISSGILTIDDHRTSGNNYTAGGFLSSVNSQGQGFSQKFGYFEARVEIPKGQGGFPAFWLMSAPHAGNGALPASELDIMEAQTDNTGHYWGTIHSDSAHSGDQINAGNHDIQAGTDLSAGFHTFGLLWDPNSSNITWFLDGKPMITAPKYSTTDSVPMMININMGMGGWNGGPNGSTPNDMPMKVDYVRAYQFSSLQSVGITPQGGFNGSPSPSPTPAPAANDPGTGSDHVTVHVSGDHWAGQAGGDPQFVVLVDGQQVGGVQTVSAVHDAGQWQDITVNGNFTAPHEVDVKFLNDAFGGTHAQDVNLYVGSITVDGNTYTGGQAASNTGSAGMPGPDANTAALYVDGALAMNVSAATPTPAPAGDPSITLHVSGDHWAGHAGGADPQFVVLVDGQQIGGVQTVSAVHDAGQWQDITVNGNFSATPHEVDVHFLNDAFGGAHAQDINLYVGSITIDGHTYTGDQAASNSGSEGFASPDAHTAAMYGNGTLAFDPVAAAPTPSPAPGASPDGATVIGTNGNIVSDAHNVYAINAAGQITENGAVMAHTNGVTELAYVNHTLYQEATSQNQWWSYNDTTHGWTQSSDPTSGISTPTATPMQPTITDGAGHDIFVFNSTAQEGSDIAHFTSGQDILDVAPLLKAVGFTGSDPIAAHVLTLQADGQGGTSVMIDPTGHDPNHGTTLVTLEHVLPQNVHAGDIWH